MKTTGLIRFRSPLLAESLLMSFPPATEMFQFTGFASHPYVFSVRYPKGVGFPIRTSADQRSLASPRGLSQRATSFIASWRQGIHRTPFSYSTSPPPARRINPRLSALLIPPCPIGQQRNIQNAHPDGLSAARAYTRYHQIFFTMRNNNRKPQHPFRDIKAVFWKRHPQA
jgi:hypothetical protein